MRDLVIVKFKDLEIPVKPNKDHNWLMDMEFVSKCYGVTEGSIRSTKSRNESELIEGKHYLMLQNATSGQSRTYINWTKRGVTRLGFFIKSERAKEFRDFAEDLIVGEQTPSVPTTLKDALLLAYNQQIEIEQKEAVIKELAPKAEYTDKVLTSVNDWTTTTIAKQLGMSAQRLNSELYKKGVQYLNSDKVWVLYAKFDDKGFTESRTHVYTDSKGEIHTRIYTVWTEKGRNFIHLLLNPKVQLQLSTQ